MIAARTARLAFGGSSSGRTTDSDSVYLGSNPSPPAKTKEARRMAGLVVVARTRDENAVRQNRRERFWTPNVLARRPPKAARPRKGRAILVPQPKRKRPAAWRASSLWRLTRSTAAAPRVLLAGLGDDLRRQLRPRRLLVPVQRLQVVAHELLVEARRAAAGAVGVRGPEPRGVGRQRLVDQRQRAALIDAELELGVGDDDAAAERRGPPRTR